MSPKQGDFARVQRRDKVAYKEDGPLNIPPQFCGLCEPRTTATILRLLLGARVTFFNFQLGICYAR